MIDNSRLLRLETSKTFHTPYSWDAALRFAVLVHGGDVTLDPGAWLLPLGMVPGLEAAGKKVEHLFRLADGRTVALFEPLAEGEATPISDPQAIAAMVAFRTLEEAVHDDLGLWTDRVSSRLAPFKLIQCPLCGGTEFTTVDLASAWCDRCNTRFQVRQTCGDPGFVVDAEWSMGSWREARYVMPKTESMSLYMVMKHGGGDPLDLTYSRRGCQDDCRPDAIALTDGSDGTLRMGLHRCHIGDVYEWGIQGRPPAPEQVYREQLYVTKIDGRCWPESATLRTLALSVDERHALRNAAAAVRGKWVGLAEELDRLADRPASPPMINPCHKYLPPLSALKPGEQYLLHRWLVTQHEAIGQAGYRYQVAWPIWYVVKPLPDPQYYRDEWEVIRRDICPVCGGQVLPEHVTATSDTGPHHWCRQSWKELGWTLPDEPVVEEGE